MKKILKILGLTLLVYSGCITASGQDLYNIMLLDINTEGKELAPAFYEGGIVFCSDRRSEMFVKYTDLNDEPLTDLYIASHKENGRFTNPRLFSRNLASKLFEGPAAFSNNGKTVYFTKNIESSYDRKEQPVMTFGIFISELVNGEWTIPVAFPYNSNSHNTGYPGISADGKTMLFCSDDSSGYGGFDIYVTRLENGRWTTPENLGEVVNTPGNEVFPFIHESGRVYFASRGHSAGGDLDIYYTRETNEGWIEPVSMPEPFNTAGDDYGLIMNPTMDTAYFVSDRQESADIFMASLTIPVFSECPEQEENNYCYLFYESNNSEMDTTAFAYEWSFGDGHKERALKVEHCYVEPGIYDVELNVIDKLTGEQFFSQANYTLEVTKTEQPYIIMADSAFAGESVIFDAKDSYYKGFEINNYYWNFGDGSLGVSEKAEHSYDAPGTYRIILGITGRDVNDVVLRECVTRSITVAGPDARK